jgi:hypothetical protein
MMKNAEIFVEKNKKIAGLSYIEVEDRFML